MKTFRKVFWAIGIMFFLPLTGYSQTTPVFEKVAECQITVPLNFSDQTFFDTLFSLAGAEALHEYFGEYYALTDSGQFYLDFHPSQSLVPGETKTAFVYKINKKVRSGDCLRFIADQGGQLPNIQGIFLMQAQQPGCLPGDTWIIGFDEPGYLFKDYNGDARVFRLILANSKNWEGNLGYFSAAWPGRKHCLLFFK